MRTRVYVAGVYSKTKTGEKAGVLEVLQNIGEGQKVCADLFDMGFAPFCPWHDKTYAIDLSEEDLDVEDFYEASLSWLLVSDCMLVISGEGLGSGVDAEIDFCNEYDIPVFYSISALEDWENLDYEEKDY